MIKERPILFSAPMVQAILAGNKTMTRRTIKSQPEGHHWERLDGYKREIVYLDCADGYRHAKFHDSIPRNPQPDSQARKCPYGKIGDRLWVRETFHLCQPGIAVYRAGSYEEPEMVCSRCFKTVKWKPSIFMPRWASRINLEITDIRVERLNDISEEDAIAEGATPSIVGEDLDHLRYRAGFQSLWESINGEGSWSENPYLWVVSFRRV